MQNPPPRPLSVPSFATWDDSSASWVAGERGPGGVPQGVWTSYRADGSLREQSVYGEQGNRHGPFRRFYPDGSLAMVGRHEYDRIQASAWMARATGATDIAFPCDAPAVTSVEILYDGGEARRLRYHNREGFEVTQRGEPLRNRFPLDALVDGASPDDVLPSGAFAACLEWLELRPAWLYPQQAHDTRRLNRTSAVQGEAWWGAPVGAIFASFLQAVSMPGTRYLLDWIPEDPLWTTEQNLFRGLPLKELAHGVGFVGAAIIEQPSRVPTYPPPMPRRLSLFAEIESGRLMVFSEQGELVGESTLGALAWASTIAKAYEGRLLSRGAFLRAAAKLAGQLDLGWYFPWLRPPEAPLLPCAPGLGFAAPGAPDLARVRACWVERVLMEPNHHVADPTPRPTMVLPPEEDPSAPGDHELQSPPAAMYWLTRSLLMEESARLGRVLQTTREHPSGAIRVLRAQVDAALRGGERLGGLPSVSQAQAALRVLRGIDARAPAISVAPGQLDALVAEAWARWDDPLAQRGLEDRARAVPALAPSFAAIDWAEAHRDSACHPAAWYLRVAGDRRVAPFLARRAAVAPETSMDIGGARAIAPLLRPWLDAERERWAPVARRLAQEWKVPTRGRYALFALVGGAADAEALAQQLPTAGIQGLGILPALVALGAPGIAPVLRDLMQKDARPAPHQRYAIAALALGDTSPLAWLLERMTPIEAWGAVGTLEFLDWLLRGAKYVNRQAAPRLLERLVKPCELPSWEFGRRLLRWSLGDTAIDPRGALQEALAACRAPSAQRETQAEVLKLATWAPPALADVITEAVADPEPAVRLAALDVLAALGAEPPPLSAELPGEGLRI